VSLYQEQLAQFVGDESPMIESVDAVCPQMIRHWVEVMQDTNPAYTDPDWAARSRHVGTVAPASMLQAWTLSPLWPTKELPALPIARLDEILAEHGFTEVVATNQSQEIVRLARAGDVVSFNIRLADVTETPKKTRLGLAYFVTMEYCFVDQHGDLLGTQSFTYMRYKPNPEGTRA
jgi:acyl dehydratase